MLKCNRKGIIATVIHHSMFKVTFIYGYHESLYGTALREYDSTCLN